MSEQFDVMATVRENKRRLILYVGKRELPKFAEIISPFVLSDFEYKLVPRRSLTP
jgi:hypothetical protein